MYNRLFQRMRASVRAGKIAVPQHAFEEMNNDELLQMDVEHCILTGEIVERQWDDHWQEWKYVIAGETVDGDDIEVVAKLGYQRHVVLITTYRI